MTPFLTTPSLAGYAFTTPAATTIASANTPVKAAGATTAMGATRDFDAGAATDNRLLYRGATTRLVKVDVAATLAAASGTNQELELSIYHHDASAGSGAIVAGSKVSGHAAATTGINGATGAVVELDTDDWLEVHVANVGATANVTVQHGVVMLIGVEPEPAPT